MQKKVSIVIPVYNAEKYINRCINSIINQTYKNIEILCIDDGSKDNSLNILKEYALKDQRIKIFSQENKGQLPSRIKGIELSTGEYVMFVDSDDWIDEETIENVLKENEKYNADIIRFTYIDEHIDENRKVFNTPIFDKIEYVKKEEFKEKIYPIFLKTHKLNSMCWQLIKKDIIKEFKFNENVRIGEDLLFNINTYTNAKNVLFIPKAYYHYRCNMNSISNSKTIQQVKDRIYDVIEVYSTYFTYIKNWKIENKENDILIKKQILNEVNKGIKLLYTFKNMIRDKKEVMEYSVRLLENKHINIRTI